MSTAEFSPGLKGVVAFETEIAEPDREGGSLRYRGIDIEELAGRVPFENVWGLLVDEALEPGLPAAYCKLPIRTGGYMSDLQAGLAVLGGHWGLKQLIDADDEQAKEDLRRLSAAALSIVAQSARGDETPVPEDEVMRGKTAAERFLLAWRGEADERHVKAVDTYWICTAEHGLNASTFTARITASTGADCAAAIASAVGALSGPLHGGAPARVLPMLDAVAELGDADEWVRGALARNERIMGFGHRVYRAEDPRARLLRRTAKELGSPRFDVAERLEQAALAALAERHPERVLATNVEFWSAVVLDVADIPPTMAPAMFACSRTAGWSAHILEQKRLARLVRPSARYVGPGERSLSSLGQS
jgi:citrate synthase